jgi:hypothetical protein
VCSHVSVLTPEASQHTSSQIGRLSGCNLLDHTINLSDQLAEVGIDTVFIASVIGLIGVIDGLDWTGLYARSG